MDKSLQCIERKKIIVPLKVSCARNANVVGNADMLYFILCPNTIHSLLAQDYYYSSIRIYICSSDVRLCLILLNKIILASENAA